MKLHTYIPRLITSLLLSHLGSSLEASPRFVPDRPGYADATASVEPGHYHLEFGGSLADEQVGAGLTVRRGLSQRWEARLSAPTLTVGLSAPKGEERAQQVGAPVVGLKWARGLGALSASSVLSVALPLTSDLTAHPLTQLTSNLGVPLSAQYSLTFTLKGALEGDASQLSDSASGRLGGAAAIGGAWGELGAFTQVALEWTREGGEELLAGLGFTYLVAEGRQVDLEFNLTQLTSSDPIATLSIGSALGW